MVAIKQQTTPAPNDWQLQLQDLQQQNIQQKQRVFWMMQLREALQQWHLSSDELVLMQQLASRLCDWMMVLSVVDRLLNENIDFNSKNNDNITDNLTLSALSGNADACLQLGIPELVIEPLRSALLVHYQEQSVFSWYRLAQQQRQLLSCDFYQDAAKHNGELWLTPMQAHHLESFRWIYSQYADTESEIKWQGQSIAQRCNLPIFESAEHWQHWLKQQQQENNSDLFAVMHKEWGMVGAVSLENYQGAGFFYYWIGEDFQGMGFGPKAVDSILSQGARYLDMHCCYAKVYDYNLPSQKALEKLGFRKLPFEVAPPYDNEWLYYLGPEIELSRIAEEFKGVLREMKSDLRFFTIENCGYFCI